LFSKRTLPWLWASRSGWPRGLHAILGHHAATSTLSTGTAALTALLPPGVFIIPDTSVCADLSLASLLQLGKDITTYAKALTISRP
jgi:hypothetical protein